MVKVIVAGAAGRMGARIMDTVLRSEGLELAGAFERADHPALGRDAGLAAGLGEFGFPLEGSLGRMAGTAQVLIDFTQPEATIKNMEAAAGAGLAGVIGTTGLTPEHRRILARFAESVPIVAAPNMSVGVNLLFKVVADVARVLGDSFDMEIVEAHHRMKKDAPSGTAVRLADILAEASGRKMSDVGVYGRQGMVGERKPEEIAVLAVRAGDIVGDHTVLFGGIGERIEITHRAHSRDTFAQGAVRAAKWVVKQPAGLYDMQDVLGLRA